MNKKISTPLAISIIVVLAIIFGGGVLVYQYSPIPEVTNNEQTNDKEQVNNEIKSVESFIPKGWQAIQTIEGDLNKDGLKDTAVVIENKSQKTTDGLLCDKYNECPRNILILFQKNNGYYELSIKSEKAILLANEGGVFGDPFEGLKIDNGSLLINFYGGSNWRWSYSYRFRYQNNDWFLIGATSYNYWNGSDCVDKTIDINFLTSKKQEIVSNKWDNWSGQDNTPCNREEKWFDIKNIGLIKLSNFEANKFFKDF